MKYVVLVESKSIEVDVDGEHVRVDGQSHRATLTPLAGTHLRQLLIDGRPLTLAVQRLNRGLWVLGPDGERWELEVLDERAHHIRSLAGSSEQHRAAGVLKAPMPGLVVRVQAEPGQQVQSGTPLVVLEAMKMENELKAPAAATIRQIRVAAGQAVEKGQVLVEFESGSG